MRFASISHIKVTDLETYLTYETPLETIQGYINTSDGNLGRNTSIDAYVAIYDVSVGQKFILNFNPESTNTLKSYAFYIDSLKTSIDGRHIYTQGIEITIPQNATKLGIQYRWNGGGSIEDIKLCKSNSLIGKFTIPLENEINNTNTILSDDLKNADKILSHERKGFLSGVDSYTASSDGIISFTTDLIYCSQGDKFLYYGMGGGSSRTPVDVTGLTGMGVSWIFYDSEGQIISAWEVTLSKQIVEIPAGVSKVKFSGIVYWPSNSRYYAFGVYKYKSLISDMYRDIENLKTSSGQSIWANLKWIAIGDSLTEHNIRATKNYHDYIHDWTGITVVNRGHSGCGYKENYSSNGAFYQRVQTEIQTDADIITIFGSGNDLHYNGSAMKYQLGQVTDTGVETICGCINTTLDYIQEHYPLIPLGIITPTPWFSLGAMGNQTPLVPQCDMEKYSDALIEICKRRGIPILDLYHCSNLHPNSDDFRNLAYRRDGTYATSTEGTTGAIQVTSDNLAIIQEFGISSAQIGDWVLPTLSGVHPDEIGHEIIAPRFKEFLSSLIKK